VDHTLVDEEAVPFLAVVVQALAVIADDDDDGAFEQIAIAEELDHAADLRVRERDLPLVGIAGIAALERFRRIVRGVRIVEMDPREKRRGAVLVDPRQRAVDDLVARALDRAHREDLVLGQIEVVEIGVEPLRDAPLRIEHVGRDEAPGRVAAGLQGLGERLLLVVEEVPAIVADAMLRRKAPGEERGVRRQRDGGRRARMIEEDAILRQRIEIRRPRARVAVRAQPVGTRRVQRDHDEVEGSRRHAARQGAQVGRTRHGPLGPGQIRCADADSDDDGDGDQPLANPHDRDSTDWIRSDGEPGIRPRELIGCLDGKIFYHYNLHHPEACRPGGYCACS
jgi:hypothetical protein